MSQEIKDKCKDCLHRASSHITSTTTGGGMLRPIIQITCLVCKNHCHLENTICSSEVLI